MLDVLADFGAFEGVQMEAHCDALAQLAQGMVVEAVAQFRLAHQNDLQKFALVGFQVGQQPDLLQQFAGQILGLVNNENGVLVVLDLLEEEAVDFRQRFPAGPFP